MIRSIADLPYPSMLDMYSFGAHPRILPERHLSGFQVFTPYRTYNRFVLQVLLHWDPSDIAWFISAGPIYSIYRDLIQPIFCASFNERQEFILSEIETARKFPSLIFIKAVIFVIGVRSSIFCAPHSLEKLFLDIVTEFFPNLPMHFSCAISSFVSVFEFPDVYFSVPKLLSACITLDKNPIILLF